MTLRVAVDALPLVEARPTGVARATFALVGALAKRSDVAVTAFAPGPLARTPAGVAVERVDGRPYRRGLAARLRERRDADVCWSPFIAVPLGAGIPVVATLHEVPRARDCSSEGIARTMRHAAWWAVTRRVAAGAIAVSEHTAGVARSRGFRRPLVVAPHGAPAVDPVIDRPPGGAVVAIGTVRAKKGVALAVAAYERLRTRPTGAPRFVWIGDGSPPTHTGGIDFVGWVDDDAVRAHLAAASCLVVPSVTEGFGLPALEALAAGCPVVVHDAGALPEVVGDCGVRVSSRRATDWADAIATVLDDPAGARDRAARGVERARRFTWGDAASRVAAFLHDVAAGG